jgi:hypothetical protein
MVDYTLKIMRMRPGRRGPVPFRVHAVSNETGRAICYASSFRGWADTTNSEVTCPACISRLGMIGNKEKRLLLKKRD